MQPALNPLLALGGVSARPSAPARDAAAARGPVGRALVMGDDTRGFLATVRSLGRQGIEVHAAPFDFRSPALVVALHRRDPRCPALDGSWRRTGWPRCGRCSRSSNSTSSSPATSATCCRCSAIARSSPRSPGLRSRATRRSRCCSTSTPRASWPSASASRSRRGGWRGLTIPRRRCWPSLARPVVVKPRRSYTLEGLARRGRVHVLERPGAARPLLADAEPDSLLLEACFEGNGLGVSILAHEGRLLQAFEHHRVHERSGSSFYRVSAAPDPALVDACAAVAAGVRLHRRRHVRVQAQRGRRVDPARGQRPAVGLAAAAGRARCGLPVPLVPAAGRRRRDAAGARTGSGVYGRNLVPDMVAALADAQAQESAAGCASALFLGAALARACAGPLVGRRAAGRAGRATTRRRPGPSSPRLARSRSRRARRTVAGRPGAGAEPGQPRGARGGAARARPVRVLFVCQGNICRSPLPPRRCGERARRAQRCRVSSAGMMPRPGPPGARAVPAGSGRAAGSTSPPTARRWLDRASAECRVAHRRVRRDQPAAPSPTAIRPPRRVVKLGDLIGVGDIADPVDGDADLFERHLCRDRGAASSALARLLA